MEPFFNNDRHMCYWTKNTLAGTIRKGQGESSCVKTMNIESSRREEKDCSILLGRPTWLHSLAPYPGYNVNPSNAEASFVQSTRTQRFLKSIETLSYWYSFESSRWVLSDEYPFARVSVIFRILALVCNGPISHQQHKGQGLSVIGYDLLHQYYNTCYPCYENGVWQDV